MNHKTYSSGKGRGSIFGSAFYIDCDFSTTMIHELCVSLGDLSTSRKFAKFNCLKVKYLRLVDDSLINQKRPS